MDDLGLAAPPTGPRVALIIPTLQLAGAEVMVSNLARALRARGVPVSVFSLYDMHTPLTDEIERAGIAVSYLGKRPGFDPRVIGRLATELEDQRIEVLHSHLPILKYTVPAVRRLDHKVRMLHTFHSVARHECGSAVARAQNRRFLRSGQVTAVALSEQVRDSVVETYGLQAHQVPTILNGIDLAKFACGERGERSGLTLLHVGRFDRVKNHQFLLDVYAKLSARFDDLSLCLVGDGPMRGEIAARVADERIPGVRFTGMQPDVAPFYAAADVFVLPSLFEGLPMSIVEAMASGLPVVASNVGGVPALVQDGRNGYVRELDVEEFASCISGLLESHDERGKFGAESRRLAIGFSSETMAARYERLYSA